MKEKGRTCFTLMIVLLINIRHESFLPYDHRRNAFISKKKNKPKPKPYLLAKESLFLVIHSKLHAQFVPPTLIFQYECEKISDYSLGLFIFEVQGWLKKQKCSTSLGKSKRTDLCVRDRNNIKLSLFSPPFISLHIFSTVFFLQHPLKSFKATEGWW